MLQTADMLEADELRALVRRYDRPGPRYTSYPTAPVWSDAFGAAQLAAALRASHGSDLSLYVHVPFCERLCSFCACNRVITRDHSVAGPYLDAVEREASLVAEAFGGERRAAQLAIGGGSPNFLSPDELVRLASIVDTHFAPAEGAERSIELDPRNTTQAQLEVLAQVGFNRISLGVQDTALRVQKAINRVQPSEQVEALVEGARRLGMASVNFDLIYGLPYQTEASFDHTLDDVIALRPDRIALYSYAHVTWISKAQRGFEKKDLPSADQKLAIFCLAIGRLTAAGYRFLGLDHFALPEDALARAADDGSLRRNFMGYTTHRGADLIGLGASGISELASAYAQSERDPAAWQACLDGGSLATIRGVEFSEEDHRRRWLIDGIMCRGSIDLAAFEARFGLALGEAVPGIEASLAPLVDDGLLARADADYAVTATGRLFLRVIAMSFDAYLEQPKAERPRFSRTV
jgi:oxygen-independent coproporphyrinogen-3 oxidase